MQVLPDDKQAWKVAEEAADEMVEPPQIFLQLLFFIIYLWIGAQRYARAGRRRKMHEWRFQNSPKGDKKYWYQLLESFLQIFVLLLERDNKTLHRLCAISRLVELSGRMQGACKVLKGLHTVLWSAKHLSELSKMSGFDSFYLFCFIISFVKQCIIFQCCQTRASSCQYW